MKNSIVMLKLGAISTNHYLEQLNLKAQQQAGWGKDFPLSFIDTDFSEINALLPEDSLALEEILVPYLKQLFKLEASYLLVPNITLHQMLDRILPKIDLDIKLIHPLQLTVAQMRRRKCTEAILFGTYYTMNASYVSTYFESKGVSVVKAPEPIMREIDEIRKKVFSGVALSELKSRLNKIADEVLQNNAQRAAVLACTELSVLHSQQSGVIDMAEQQLNCAVELVFG